MPSPKKISDIKPLLTNVAKTSHYQVQFGGLHGTLMKYLSERDISQRFITEDAGLLCSSASLPGSSLATADINGNRMGVSEKMAHTRIFSDISLEFYVDSDYRILNFLEHWIEFASNGHWKTDGTGKNMIDKAYYYRMRYPSEYKCESTKIYKFDNGFDRMIEYTFYGMFPINLSSLPVSYQSSDVLRVSASFNFERYIAGSTYSQNRYLGTSGNRGIRP